MRKGFTLIELSIVLVIIALIVGGILVGRDMIRVSELRTVLAELEKFDTARNAFRVKYNCVAGDCANASQFNLGTNGNGNGVIDYWNAPTDPAWRGEHFYHWMHLGNAYLIEGTYTGSSGPSDPNFDTVIGLNIPASKIKSVGYTQTYYPLQLNTWGLESSRFHYYMVGRVTSTMGWATLGGAFTVREMLAIDQKVDDGLANSGRIRSREGLSTLNTVGCTTGAAPNYTYDSSTNGLCNLLYGFLP